MAPIQIHHFLKCKQEQRPIVALTAADYAIAQLLDLSDVDLILVGDSLAMTSLGYENTLPLTLDQLIHHCAAVRRGVKRAFLVGDLPFLSYQINREQALSAAKRLVQEGGAAAVKIEGGYPRMVETVGQLVEVGIPVLGHIGLTPQAVHQTGGFRRQGTTDEAAERLLTEAKNLEAAGAFALVLEHMPGELAQSISEKLQIPTLGIGAGAGCDGQILVTNDVLGLTERMPPFAKAYANLRESIADAVNAYSEEVRRGKFPAG